MSDSCVHLKTVVCSTSNQILIKGDLFGVIQAVMFADVSPHDIISASIDATNLSLRSADRKGITSQTLFIFQASTLSLLLQAGSKFWPGLKVSDHQALIVSQSASITSFSITAGYLNPIWFVFVHWDGLAVKEQEKPGMGPPYLNIYMVAISRSWCQNK